MSKANEIVQLFEDEDEELIEPTEKDDVLITHMVMTDLLKKYRKRKINDTKDEDLYIYCRFIFGSATRAEMLFSYCKFITRETRHRLTPQIFDAITFLKSNRELWEKLTTINLTYNIDEQNKKISRI